MNLNKLLIDIRRSKCLRLLVAPVVLVNKKREEKEYLELPDRCIIREYKNIHKGKRCFIVGNGPSLTIEDLEKLNNEITFGTNGIFYAYNKTNWRPTYYMSIDNSFLDSEINNIKENIKERKFLNFYSRKYGREKKDNIVYFLIKGPYKINRKNFYQKDISMDVSKYFAQTFSVTTTCIEFAIYMGFSEIYLIGVDNNYSTVLNDKKNKTNQGQLHFYKIANSQTGIVHYADNQVKSYKLYGEFAQKHGVKIFNATKGGKLEVYPRVDLDDVLSI